MQFSKSIVHSFSKANKITYYKKKDSSPGPGAYQYAREFNLKKASGFK